MADINSSLPVRTQTDGDVVVKVTDGTLTATVRNTGTNDSLNVAIVDAAGNQITSFTGGTQYAEDDASTGGELLTLAGVVRQNSPAASTDADGDYTYLKSDSAGRLWVNASGAAVPVTDNASSLTVDNSGTFAVQVDGAALTSLQLIDDIVKTDDAAFSPATDKVAMIGAEFDDAAPDSVDEGDAGALRMSGRRELYVQLRDAAGNERGVNVDASGRIGITDGAGSLTVDGTVSVDNITTSVTPGTGAGNLGKAEDAVHSSGDTGVMALAVRKDTATGLAADGDYHVLEVDSSGRLHVNVGNTVGVTFGEALSTTEVNDYDTASAVAAAGTDNHDYTVVGTMRLKQISCSASGKMKVELQVGPVGTLVSKGVWFNSTSNPNIDIIFAQPIEVPNASTGTVRLVRTNLEAVAQDVYSLIIGNDI